MRSCLGTFNYWRGYIRKFSDIVAPLVAVTRKNVLWIWRDDVEGEAVRTLKQALLDSPVLIPPNSDKPYHAVTAASDYAVGASLEQEEGGEGSRCRPVAFFSHSLNPAERKYPTHERELLGIVLALRTWRVCLVQISRSTALPTTRHYSISSSRPPYLIGRLRLGATGTNPSIPATTCYCGQHVQGSDIDHAMTCPKLSGSRSLESTTTGKMH